MIETVKFFVEVLTTHEGRSWWEIVGEFPDERAAMCERQAVLGAFPYALVRIVKEETTVSTSVVEI